MKRFHLEDGLVAFRWHGRSDPRGYVPPRKYEAVADLVETHPFTGRVFKESEWWIFLRKKSPKK